MPTVVSSSFTLSYLDLQVASCCDWRLTPVQQAQMVNVGLLTAIGYDPSLTPDRVEVTTGSGVVYAPRLEVSRIKALGQERAYFPVLAHTLPPSAGVDGLLGLDFLREQALNIDFRYGRLSLS